MLAFQVVLVGTITQRLIVQIRRPSTTRCVEDMIRLRNRARFEKITRQNAVFAATAVLTEPSARPEK
jgi:hypothetical protein